MGCDAGRKSRSQGHPSCSLATTANFGGAPASDRRIIGSQRCGSAGHSRGRARIKTGTCGRKQRSTGSSYVSKGKEQEWCTQQHYYYGGRFYKSRQRTTSCQRTGGSSKGTRAATSHCFGTTATCQTSRVGYPPIHTPAIRYCVPASYRTKTESGTSPGGGQCLVGKSQRDETATGTRTECSCIRSDFFGSRLSRNGTLRESNSSNQPDYRANFYITIRTKATTIVNIPWTAAATTDSRNSNFQSR